MRLVYKITLTFIFPLAVTLGLWGWLSYRTMEKKILADTDLILRSYSDDIILRFLSGKELPPRFNGVYNTYHIEEITAEETGSEARVEYLEAEAYLRSQEDFASSRIRRQTFRNNEGAWYRLTVSLPTFERDVLVEHVLWWTVVLFFVLMVAIIFIGMIVLGYNMKPLYRLLEWMEEYEPGKPSGSVPSDTDVIEFRRLASTVQLAVDRFEKQYEERKMFIGNVAHELQTPLAVCINRMEMLLDYPSLDEEMAEELVKVHRSLTSLSRMNKSLLMLARIENGQYSQLENIDMTEAIRESIALNEEIYSYKEIRTMVRQETADLYFRMDGQMAAVLVGNLVRNAFRYAPQGSLVEVVINDEGFSVINEGGSPLDKNHVFRRFYQPSGRKEGSTGLGLALASAICTHSGLGIGYEYADGFHRFSVNLKK